METFKIFKYVIQVWAHPSQKVQLGDWIIDFTMHDNEEGEHPHLKTCKRDISCKGGEVPVISTHEC